MTPYVKVDFYKHDHTTASISIIDRDTGFNVAECDTIGVSFFDTFPNDESVRSITTCVEVIFCKDSVELQSACVELQTCSLFDVKEFDTISVKFHQTNSSDTGSDGIYEASDNDSSDYDGGNGCIRCGFYGCCGDL